MQEGMIFGLCRMQIPFLRPSCQTIEYYRGCARIQYVGRTLWLILLVLVLDLVHHIDKVVILTLMTL